MKGQEEQQEKEAARLRAEYAQKTPAEMAQVVTEYDERQAWIDTHLTAETVKLIFDPFFERISAKRALVNQPSPDTQCVTLVLPSTQALMRRIKNPLTDEPIMELLFESLAGKPQYQHYLTARHALESNNAVTLFVIATWLPVGLASGDASKGNAIMTHSFTGVRFK
jgi:hypothetical protein